MTDDERRYLQKLLGEASDADRPHVVRVLQKLDDAEQRRPKSMAERIVAVIHDHVTGIVGLSSSTWMPG
jgi:hypothetical protein